MNMSEEYYQAFLDLAGRLEPENLHEDGEASLKRVREKLKQLKTNWKVLERGLGRHVTEEEIWDECHRRCMAK